MFVVFPPIFVADTKIINGYNFVAPLKMFLFLFYSLKNYFYLRNSYRHRNHGEKCFPYKM